MYKEYIPLFKSKAENKYKKILDKYENKIDSTLKEYIKITAQKEKDLCLWQSKFFGKPYLLKNNKYPTDDKGNYLYLLAQLNFSEIPAPSPYFPKKGLLQFWISPNDLYGLNFENRTKQDGFKIIYHKEVQENNDDLVQDFNFLPQIDSRNNWISEDPDQFAEYSLDFKLDQMPVTSCDISFYKLFADEFKNHKFNKFDFMDEYNDIYNKKYMDHNRDTPNHIIGGYPYFTQEDPRFCSDKDYDQYNILLFQIDSDIKNKIFWGDMGIANFFIKLKDLEKLDFTNVFYNWDCS